MKINNSVARLAGTAALATLAVSGTALADNHAGTTYKFGGYVKFDSMFTDYSDGTPDSNSLISQFYYATQTQVGEVSGNSAMTTGFQGQ